MRELILHIGKFDCFASSRILMQLKWDSRNVLFLCSGQSNASIKAKEWCVEYRELSLRSMAKLLMRKPVRVVFHAQAVLPYLLILKVGSRAFGHRTDMVYDMHDLHERMGSSGHIWVRWVILGVAEFLALRIFRTRCLTVSPSIAREVSLMHGGVEPALCFNIPERPLIKRSLKRSSEPRVVYFGRFEDYRLSERTILAFAEEGVPINVYGRIVSDYRQTSVMFEKFAKIGKIKLHGEYIPDGLDFLLAYHFSIIDYSTSLARNTRYCLPNKLFQSLRYGLTVLVSPNLVDAINLFSEVPFAVVPLPEDMKGIRTLMERCLHERPSGFSEIVNNYMDSLAQQSKEAYLGMNRD